MTKILLDDAVLDKFAELTEYAELCDKSGKIVGYFSPVDEHNDELYANFKPPCDDEELDRREREPGGRSLADFWQQLDPK